MSQPGESVDHRGLWRRFGVARFRGAVIGAAAAGVCLSLLAAPAVALADDGYWHDSGSNGVARTDWMGGLSDTLMLSELTVPGTHDSGALYGGDSAQTQSMSISTQLGVGVRAFDIRLGWNVAPCVSPDLWVVHGITCQQQKFVTVIQTMKSFLDAHPRESIVMDLQDDTPSTIGDGQSNTQFDGLVQSALSPYASYIWKPTAPGCSSQTTECVGNPTLGQIRGKIVIIQEYWPTGAWSGLSGGRFTPHEFNIQDNWSMPDNYHLADKWDHWNNIQVDDPTKSVLPQFKNANSGSPTTPFINELAASTGGFPYFFASGKSSSGTNDPALRTIWTRGIIDTCTPNYECISAYPNVNCVIGTCSVAFAGLNQLSENAINANTGWKRLGIVFADFPGPGSASTPGLIGTLIGVNTRYATPKRSQTITLPTILTHTFGDAAFTWTPTSTSTLPVSVASGTTAVCTVASNSPNAGWSVTIVAAGSCTLNANQAGDVLYNAAPQASETFTVNKKAQTITFPQVATQSYGPNWPTVTPSSTSGLFVTVAATTSTCAAVNSNNSQTYTIQLLGAGTCTLTANQAGNANYLAASQAQQSFTINKIDQTITFAAITTKTLSTAPFAVSPTSTSGLAVTVASTTTGTCTVSANTVTLVAPGMCSLSASQAGDGNYNAATPVAQSFDVVSSNLVKDGGFESPIKASGINTTYNAGQKIGPWSVAAGSIDLASGYWQNGAGAQSLDMAGVAPGTISQTITLSYTATYTVKFKFAGNPEGNPVKKHMLITANAPTWGSPVTTSKVFDTTTTTISAMGWKAGKLTFPGTAGDLVTLTFQDTDAATAWGMALDAVVITAG